MPLTPKQIAFIAEYLKDFNATQAAIRAGYSEKSAALIGHQNIKKLNIAEEIERHLAERIMSAEEAMLRLSEMARADMSDFLHVDHGYVSLNVEGAIKQGKSHLIKKWKGPTKTAGPEIELHDSKDALKFILQVYDKVHSDDWKGEIIEYLKAGKLTPEEVTEELGHELASELFATAGFAVGEGGTPSPESKAAQS